MSETATGRWSDPGIQVVLMGYSSGILAKLDSLLPAGSVVVVEEPEVIVTRGVIAATASSTCVAFVEEAHIHDELGASDGVTRFVRPPGVRGVVGAVDYGVVWAAHLAELWGLPGLGAAGSILFRDKALLRAAAESGGVPQPQWALARTVDDARLFAGRFDGGVVVKPSNLQASVGVELVRDIATIDGAFATAAAASEPKYRASTATASRVLIEQLVDGREVSVEAFVSDGVVGFFNVTAKAVRAGRFPVEVGHTVPADDISPECTDQLRSAVDTLVASTGVHTAVLHSEWIITDDGVWLVECAARLPGDGIDQLISLAYDFDFVTAWLSLLTGADSPSPRVASRAAATSFASQSATSQSAEAAEAAARQYPGIVSALVKAGDYSEQSVRDSGGRNCAVIAIGDTASQARERALSALDALTSILRTAG